MDDEQVIRKAARAGIEYAETAWAFAAMRAELIERWVGSTSGETAHREKLFVAVQTLDAVQKALLASIDNGKVARHSAEMTALLNPQNR